MKTTGFFIGALLIALGFTQVPVIPDNLGRGPIWGDVLVWAIALAPILPTVAVLIKLALSIQAAVSPMKTVTCKTTV